MLSTIGFIVVAVLSIRGLVAFAQDLKKLKQ
jgi:hypothetical protein